MVNHPRRLWVELESCWKDSNLEVFIDTEGAFDETAFTEMESTSTDRTIPQVVTEICSRKEPYKLV